MIITVTRFGFGADSTGGLLHAAGLHVGFTCEDQRRPGPKVMHETCIPVGRYQVMLRNEGGMNEEYKRKYPFHRGMLHLQNVPGFTWIYLHVGNTDDHTSGCILVGRSITRARNGEYSVRGSVDCYTDLYKLIFSAINSGEEVWVEVM